jgi:hypothetical protein
LSPSKEGNAVRPRRDARLRNTVGGLVLACCVVVALIRALTADFPAPKNRLGAADRERVGRAAAREEPVWREKTRKTFPGDRWSQDDDFGASEKAWINGQASRRRVPVVDVLQAIDEDLRANPPRPPRSSTAAPSRPRPFYD